MSEKFDRKTLYRYLMNRYEVTSFPKSFYIKMSNIFNGKLSTISKAIPPEHLYDMWVKKENYLNKVYMDNTSKGKTMSGYVRCNYDLSILMSRYDDYLKWLDRAKNEVQENEKVIENVQTTTAILIHNTQNIETKDNSIYEMLDEMI